MNSVMKIEAGKKLTESQIKEIAGKKQGDYERNQQYYKSKNPELTQIWEHRRQEQVDPNNYAPSGYAGYIVDIMTGYIASPGFVEYSSENEDYIKIITDINKENKEATLTNQEAREMGIQGKNFELHFIEKTDDKKAMPRFVSVPGYECYPIFTDALDPKLAAMVRVIMRKEDEKEVWVYDDKVYTKYLLKKDVLTIIEKPEKHYYNEVPWNIGRNNIDWESDFAVVTVHINIIDAIQTNNLNALDKNARAVILTSLEKSTELAKNLKNLNMVFDMEKGDSSEGKDFFDYASMELNTDLREFMLEYFIKELHKISGIFDFTKLELGEDPSGTALKYRIYPMELKASGKVAYMLEFLRHRYELVNQIINKFTLPGNTRYSTADVNDLDITMKRNLPANIKAILEENQLMADYVDKKTKLERIPGINPETVLERLDGEPIEDPFGETGGGMIDIKEADTPAEAIDIAKLSGIQINAANNIISAVSRGELSRSAGINQLQVFLGLTKAQSEKVMSNTGKGNNGNV